MYDLPFELNTMAFDIWYGLKYT